MEGVQKKSGQSLGLSFRYARRELRSGFSGFAGFLFCLALGVGGIAIVGSFSQAVRSGLAEEGRVLLGGDVEFALSYRQAGGDERSALDQYGLVSEVATLRAMLTVPGRQAQSLIQIKAVDERYPLFGELVFEPETRSDTNAVSDAKLPQISVDSSLLASLQIELGGQVKIGNQVFEVGKVIQNEPDRMSSGFMIGPRVLMSRASLDKTGLIQPGSLVRWRYRIRFPETGSIDADETVAAVNQRFPKSGWHITTRANATPGIRNFVDRLAVFLTLVGFTTLLVAGVGIANSVKSYVDAKRSVIATYKCLGATGNFITTAYLLQIMLVSAVGIGIGVSAGALIPYIGLSLLADMLPVPAKATVFIQPLAISALFGLLTSFAFAIWPLGRIRQIAPSALFRDLVATTKQYPKPLYIFLFFITCLALGALLVFTSSERLVSAMFVAGATVGFAALALVAIALMAVVKRLPLFKTLELRLAISNLHRPGAATVSAVLSLGLGLTLLLTLMLIDKNLVQQLGKDLPDKVPSFFFVDIQRAQIEPFEALVQKSPEVSAFSKVPMLRGRIMAMKNIDVDKLDVPASARWVLHGDRGITYSKTLPEGSTLIKGEWWRQDYAGPPLVSFTDTLATQLGLSIGDSITVNILGRNITAKIANTRAVEWRSFGINFVLVFSPNTLEKAPHTFLSTVTLPKQGELALMKSISSKFANITSIRVREVLGTVNSILENLIVAIRAASSLSFVTAIVVLAGAIAAGRRQRTYDAVVLKTLGATRKMLVRSYCLEYGILGLCSGIFALGVGSLGAYLVVEHVLDVKFVFFPGLALVTVLLAALGTVAVGLISSWRILGERPAAILRSQN